MKTKLHLVVICCLVALSCSVNGAENEKQQKRSLSFIVLGDIHYDNLDDHYMPWLEQKPGDLKQVTDTYAPNTKLNWNDFMDVLRAKIAQTSPAVAGIVQLGDLSEGLAGSDESAVKMANTAVNATREAKLGVPWIIAKGNHDVTGPGAKEAFTGVYTPYIREQLADNSVKNASYSYRVGPVQFVAIDPWDSKVDPVAFINESFSNSDSKYRFVILHEPIIPISERCWHFMRKTPDKRPALLEAIARNKAFVLAAHLHRYSVVKRNTPAGPIVQVMAVSVIGKTRRTKPTYSFITKDYGASLVDWKPTYEPATADARRAMLEQEKKFVSYYTMCDLPGYALISIDDDQQTVKLDYYAAFGKTPYDSVNLTELYNAK